MAYAPFDWSGKIAVVMGGTSGIGRAIAHGLVEAGADVVATSRRQEQVEPPLLKLKGAGGAPLAPSPTSLVAARSKIFSIPP